MTLTFWSEQWTKRPITTNPMPVVPDISTWSDIIAGLIFLAAFGFGTEAIAVYSQVMSNLRRGSRRLWRSKQELGSPFSSDSAAE